MKKISLFITLFLTCAVTFAQTVTVSGTVNDQKGKPVPFAFIRDSQHPYGTFSDSTGSFIFKADPTSQLIASARNLPAMQVQITTTDVKIVLPGDYTTGTVIINNNVFDAGGAIANIAGAGGSVSSISSGQQATHGNRYLFNKWAHGFAVAPDNSVIQKDEYLFNYNKIDGDILFTTDGTTIHNVVRAEIKSFTLFDDNGQQYKFEDVPAIDAKHYLQVIGSGTKYKIYKNLGTRFIKSNFTTSGISSSGNKYDEYVDESTYYLVKMPDGQPQKLAAKKKAIKAAFPAEADKVNKYVNDNDKDIDDAYLKGLLDVLNQ